MWREPGLLLASVLAGPVAARVVGDTEGIPTLACGQRLLWPLPEAPQNAAVLAAWQPVRGGATFAWEVWDQIGGAFSELADWEGEVPLRGTGMSGGWAWEVVRPGREGAGVAIRLSAGISGGPSVEFSTRAPPDHTPPIAGEILACGAGQVGPSGPGVRRWVDLSLTPMRDEHPGWYLFEQAVGGAWRPAQVAQPDPSAPGREAVALGTPSRCAIGAIPLPRGQSQQLRMVPYDSAGNRGEPVPFEVTWAGAVPTAHARLRRKGAPDMVCTGVAGE